jgi:hypothetical protein
VNHHDFAKGMENLCGFYDRKLPSPAGMSAWFNKIKWLETKNYMLAIDAITTSEKFFPTPEVVLRYAEKVRAQEAQRAKANERWQAQNTFKPERQRSKIGQDVCRFVKELFAKRFDSEEQRLEWKYKQAKSLNEKYPNAGFDDLAKEATREMNHVLDERYQGVA